MLYEIVTVVDATTTVVRAVEDPPNTEPVSDLVMWSAIVGFVLPPLVAFVNQATWPGWARALVALAACIGAGAGTAAFDGSLTGQRWATAVLVVLTAALGFYTTFWKPSKIAPAIEQATTLSSPPERRY